jgi:hypothetical protein
METDSKICSLLGSGARKADIGRLWISHFTPGCCVCEANSGLAKRTTVMWSKANEKYLHQHCDEKFEFLIILVLFTDAGLLKLKKKRKKCLFVYFLKEKKIQFDEFQ